MGNILAFSGHQVCSVTGLTLRQLAYWDKTGFFSPAFPEDGYRSPYSRVYSFRDVVGLRAIAKMRKQFGVPLQQLRQVGAYLADRYDEPWSLLTFYIVVRQVFYKEGEAVRSADLRGQTVFPFAMDRVEAEVRGRAERLLRRSTQDIGRVTRQRFVA